MLVSNWTQKIRDRHSNESWNWFVKSSIPGALSPVLENFLRRFSRRTRPTAPWSSRMSSSRLKRFCSWNSPKSLVGNDYLKLSLLSFCSLGSWWDRSLEENFGREAAKACEECPGRRRFEIYSRLRRSLLAAKLRELRASPQNFHTCKNNS